MTLLNRRQVLAASTALLGWPSLHAKGVQGLSDAALLDDLALKSFNFFWDTAHPETGLVPDRWPGNPNLCSVAAVGFALTAYVVGADAGYVSREQALQRCLLTAKFLADLPQGTAARGCAGYQGFFYHFLDMRTGLRFDKGVELSSIDTSLLLAGLQCAQQYFNQHQHADEAELHRVVERLANRINWRWMVQRPGLICMGWKPEGGFQGFIDYHGYDEAMLLYLQALGSPTHAVDANCWQGFTSTYARTWGRFQGQTFLGGAPHFWHQYSHVWVEFQGIQDAYMRAQKLDYFENSRRATLAQQAYAQANPGAWAGYDGQVWGLTACDGPGMIKGPDHLGREVQFHDYRARGAGQADTLDDGTIAPTAALASLPFAPEVVLPALRALRERHGEHIYGRYGFLDSFNLSYRAFGQKLSDGREVPGWGWVASDYLGIDQGPILAMWANHRNGLIWRTMRRLPSLRRGLKRAGFQGGWLERSA